MLTENLDKENIRKLADAEGQERGCQEVSFRTVYVQRGETNLNKLLIR